LFASFENREEGKQKAIDSAKGNLLAYNKNLNHAIQAQDYSIITIIGGSGSGKTRAAREIGNVLRTSEVSSIFNQSTSNHLTKIVFRETRN